jgi:hypothetical protein
MVVFHFLKTFGIFAVFCGLCISKVFVHYLTRLAVPVPWNMCQGRTFWISGLTVEPHGLVFFQVIYKRRLHTKTKKS